MEPKVQKFINRFPLLLPTIEKLEANNITWLIGGSGCLYLLGNDRLPEDVDIFISDDKHDLADELFNVKSFMFTSDTQEARNSNPEGDHSIQLTSHLKFNFDKEYNLGLTKEVIDHAISLENLWLMPAEEVILIKALLQRGVEEGKHDIEDIKNFQEKYVLDTNYLEQRIETLGAKDRVKYILK